LQHSKAASRSVGPCSYSSEIGYLTYATTAEAFRRRGSHTAVIAARIEEARRLGCTLILTKTLTMLRDSYANLTRAGFQVAYEKEVYECVRSSAAHRSGDHEARNRAFPRTVANLPPTL
jgi:GNAT superfamily N-acetyltransferase